MQEKLPRVIQIDGKRHRHVLNRQRLRKLIRKRFDSVSNTLPLPDLALHQLIALSVQNLTVLPKKKALCEALPKEQHYLHPSACNKKVVIFNQRSFDSKENQIVDLKTCKSLLNAKVNTPKKLVQLFNRRQRNRYTDQGFQSLWDISNRNSTEVAKPSKHEDFDLVPWGIDDNDKQNKKYYV